MMTRRTLIGSAAGWAMAALNSAAAADIWNSEWSKAKHSALRLLAGGGQRLGPLTGYAAAIEITLDAGFKTYWRDPGDSGVPPTFDWSASDNVDRVEVVWPAPFRFPDAGSFSIGYKDKLLLPLAVTAKDAAQPGTLRLKLDYAVCDKQCIPEQAQAALTLPQSGESPHIISIGEAFERAPKRVNLNDMQYGMGLRAISHRTEAKPVLVLEAVVPRYAKGLDVFVEGPSGAFFGMPKVSALGLAQPGNPLPLEAFLMELVLEQKPTGTPQWDVRLTLVTEDGAIEHSLRLDGLAAAR
ncbi:MAG: protein-disulfide reductase DsbD domain-containing protein [Beijerinckiaceae bacterium]